jgi:hypothetical protein
VRRDGHREAGGTGVATDDDLNGFHGQRPAHGGEEERRLWREGAGRASRR